MHDPNPQISNGSFYASGFLYNLKSQRILLLQSSKLEGVTSLWSMLGGESNDGEEAPTTFQRIINEALDLSLKHKNIYPIYDYFHSTLNKINYVFYAEVKRPPKNNTFKEDILSWVTFSDALKLLFSAHTKQDLVVGERVINLKWRIDQNLQY